MDYDIDPSLDGPGKDATIRIWKDGKDQPATMRWGFAPIEPGGRALSLLRAERWEVHRPCLVPASEFALKQEGTVKYRAKLKTDKPFFCLAGMWRPASHQWPASFAVLTVEAYPDIEPYKERHVAVLRPEDWFSWLTEAKPTDEMLHPFPAGSFDIVGAPKQQAVGDLFD